MPRRKGFTLIEIMVVCGILGILFAVGIPSFSSYRAKQACARAADIILADLKLSKERAIALDLSRPNPMPNVYDYFPGCGIVPISPVESTGYIVYEQRLNTDLATLQGPKVSRTVTIGGKGPPVKFALFPYSTPITYPTDFVDFYRRPEDDWTGVIRVYCGDMYTGYICDIYVGITPDGATSIGHLEMLKRF
ncbi:MAG: prepilin-type N-terminal cleavage/methylation domain-containing protein [bacterium]